MFTPHHIRIAGAALALALVLLLVVLFLIRRDRDEASKINLDELLLDDVTGKTSKTAVVFFGSFIVTSWVVVMGASKGTLSDASFAAYVGGWVAPVTAKIIWNKRKDGDAQ